MSDSLFWQSFEKQARMKKERQVVGRIIGKAKRGPKVKFKLPDVSKTLNILRRI